MLAPGIFSSFAALAPRKCVFPNSGPDEVVDRMVTFFTGVLGGSCVAAPIAGTGIDRLGFAPVAVVITSALCVSFGLLFVPGLSLLSAATESDSLRIWEIADSI